MRALDKRMLLLAATCCCVITLAAMPLRAAAAVRTQALSISPHGQIAGLTWPGGGFGQPFLYDRGTLTLLDPLGEWDWRQAIVPVDVNDQGQVIASAARLGTLSFRPLLFDRGRIIDLLGSRTGDGAAMAINGRGQVLGATFGTGLEGNGFLWTNGELTDLGPLGFLENISGQYPHFTWGYDLNDHGDAIIPINGISSALVRNGVRTTLDFAATAINDHAQVIGNSASYFGGGAGGTTRAYLWENGVRTDLGTLGGGWSFATAINDHGQIAGMSQTASGEVHAFRWERGRMVDLGNPAPGTPLVVEWINKRGEVVGSTVTVATGQTWLWGRGEVVTLPTTGNPCCFAPWPRVMIDDRGRVAYNEYANSSFDAYLWEDGEATPLDAPAPAAVARSPMAPRMAAKPLGSPGASVSLALSSGNPSSGPAILRYAVPAPNHVAVEVFDIRGSRVRVLVDEWQSAGSRSVSWDGADAAGRRTAAGVYQVRLRVGAESRSLKLVRRH